MIGTAALLPEFTWAVEVGNTNANGILGIIIGILENIIIILLSLAVLYFIFGLVKYISTAASDDKTEAAGVIMNGIIILFVMTSLWGLVAIVSETFLNDSNNGQLEDSSIKIRDITK